jgi:SLOG cluster2
VSVSPRPLAGLVVNLSISESEESHYRGFPAWQVNRVMLQVVVAFFGQGAGVAFGHNWREDGVMEAVHSFAQQVQPPVPLSPLEAKNAAAPLLQNYLPWPDEPRLSREDLERLSSTLRVEKAGLPEQLQHYGEAARMEGSDSPRYRYVRARGLTHLRHRLDAVSDARFCLGGRITGSTGRYPGIIEEALLALQEGKPLYLAGVLGGAAHQVIRAIEGQRIPETFCRPTPINELYASPPFPNLQKNGRADLVIDRNAAWTTFQAAGREVLAERNMLTIPENDELFHTPVLDQAIRLVLTGLSRLRQNSRM